MDNIKQLASAVMLQAAKDYVKSTSGNRRKAIIKDLRSPWMLALSGNVSEVVAEKLISDPEGVKERMKIHS